MKILLESAPLQEPEVIIRGDVTSEAVLSLLQLLKKPVSGKLLLSKQEEQFPVDAAELVFLEARDGKVFAFTVQDAFETRLKLYELKAQLDAHGFVQISKSVLVNMNFVRSIQAEFSGNYRVRLKGRKEVLTISRKYFKDFKDRI